MSDYAKLLSHVDHTLLRIDATWVEIKQEVAAIKSACNNNVLKVIIETYLLTDAQKIKLCQIVTDVGADRLGTSRIVKLVKFL